MSSRTPEECVEIALDDSADRADREAAIDALEAANECDELANIISNDRLETHYREQALQAIATPQCNAMLEQLVEDRSLGSSLQTEAESLLEELDGA